MTLKTPIFLENDTTTQNSDELRLERMYLSRSRSGVYTTASFAVSQRGAGANMSVDVAAGGAVVLGTENALQGSYHVVNDATVNLVVTAADATNPRKDLVILRIRDSFYSGANDDAQLEVVAGTPAASPAEPDLDALGYENYLTLAMIDVPASDTAITDSQITDRRYRAPVGGDYVGTSAQRAALTGMSTGDLFYETDTGRTYRYRTTWRFVSSDTQEEIQYAEVNPAANRDVTSVSAVNWTTETTSVTVPPWATKAIVETFIDGFFSSGADCGMNTYTSFQGTQGGPHALSLVSGIRTAIAWVEEFTGLTAGSATIQPRARRSSGTGTLRADTGTKFTYKVEFKSA